MLIGNVSLKGVRAFEAVARLGSFRAAAAELNLTPSAVSHAVIALERSMGVGLIDRKGQRGRLTDRGEVFRQHVGLAFEHLQRGLEETALRAPRLLRLHASPSFAAGWLSPRLPGFLSGHPDIDIRLSAGTDYSQFTNDDFDADIVYGPVRAANVEIVPLVTERVAPMCAPALAERIHSPEDLLGLHLIQSDNKTVRWGHWFEANGMPPPKPQGIRFDRSFLAIAAAADGLGVALESTLLAERELAAGRLVTPLMGLCKDVEYVGHHLVYPRADRPNPMVARFADWLSEELRPPPERSMQRPPERDL